MSAHLALLGHLIEYSHREAKAQYRQYLETLRGESDLDEQGTAVGGASLVSIEGGEALYRLHSEETKLRIEDRIILVDAADRTRKIEGCEVLELSKRSREVRLRVSGDPPQEALLIESLYPEIKELRASLESIAMDLEHYPLVSALLSRKGSAPTHSETYLADIRRSFQDRIDGSVAETIARASLLENGFLVVQGPPGTGKTFAGAHLVVALMALGQKVAILAQSHKAINHLCEEVSRVSVEYDMPFRGAKAASRDRDKCLAESFENLSGSQLVSQYRHYDCLAGTVYQLARLPDGSVDTLVCDEAGQLSLCYVVGAARAATNAVLLGDHRQLPHVTQATHPGKAGSSIFDYLLGDSPVVPEALGVFLAETRRMNRQLTRLLSDLCYQGQLTAHAEAAGRELGITDDIKDPLGPSGVFFYPVEHQGNSQASAEEASVVEDLVTRARHSLPDQEIMVVVPYRAQENEIRARLGDKVRVGTVDRFQGQEADLVIYSMATSDGECLPRDYRFLFSINRLNVALSRARKKAILVCSPRLLEAYPDSLEKMRLVNALCRVKEFHQAIVNAPAEIVR